MIVLAHVGGVPLEETLASAGPALLVAFWVAWANLRARAARYSTGPSHDQCGRVRSSGTDSGRS